MNKKLKKVLESGIFLICALVMTVSAYAAPQIKSIGTASKTSFKIVLAEPAAADTEFDVWYGTNKKVSKGVKKTTAQVNAGEDTFVVPNIVTSATKTLTYYVKIRDVDDETGEWSNVKKKKIGKAATLDNVKCLYGLEGDVKMKGSGTGYHAKFLLTTGAAGFSFGIQYDKACGEDFARGKQAFMYENIGDNIVGAGGDQKYGWPGKITVKEGSTHHVMLLVTKDKKIKCYVDYKLVGTFYHKKIAEAIAAGDPIYTLVEGSCRLDGDAIDVTFSNLRKIEGKKVCGKFFSRIAYENGKGIKYVKAKNGENVVQIKGKLYGLNGQDWDSAFGICSTSVRIDNYM